MLPDLTEVVPVGWSPGSVTFVTHLDDLMCEFFEGGSLLVAEAFRERASAVTNDDLDGGACVSFFVLLINSSSTYDKVGLHARLFQNLKAPRSSSRSSVAHTHQGRVLR